MTRAMQDRLDSGFTSTRRELETVRSVLSQVEQSLIPVAKSQVTSRLVGLSAKSTSSQQDMETVTKATSHIFRLPIGSLLFTRKTAQIRKVSKRGRSKDCMKYSTHITFVSPSWLSNMAIQYCIALDHDLNVNQHYWGAHLQPLTVNNNPFFLNAIRNMDAKDLARAFEEGLATPNDYVLNDYQWLIGRAPVVPWYEVGPPYSFQEPVSLEL